jgi:hypothetical protein
MRLQPHQLAALTRGEPLPPPLPKKKRDNPEWRIQAAFFALAKPYLDERGVPRCLLFSVPNGSVLGGGKEEWRVKERQIRGRLLKLAGQANGVVDVIFLCPRNGRPALLIEFKAPNGVLDDDQIIFRDAAIAAGYVHRICYSAEEGLAALTNYIK